MSVTFAYFHHLPQPDQTRLLTAHGRLLATRLDGGIRQHLYDLRGFFVETWHWADDERIGLLISFSDVSGLDGWLVEIELA